MSASLDSRSETAKLARLLGLDGSASLSYLEQVPAAQLRDYRDAVVDLLYDGDREQLQRTADASRLLPARTLAKIGESALGPLVCARLAALLDPSRAADIADHFSIAFLAELAAELDPRRAIDVVVATSPARVVAIAGELAARGEFVAMGRFVAHLDDDTLRACLQALCDEDVVRVAFVLEGDRGQQRVFELLGAARMREVLAAADAAGLRDEAEYLREHLSAAQRKQLNRDSKR